jgi:hypothetical protein
VTNVPKQQTVQSIKKESEQLKYDWWGMIALLDYACCKVAERYNLYLGDQPRKATIIEVLARTNCIGCVDKRLRTRTFERIDNMYTELHQFACSMLVEELYGQLVENGHRVTITTEENLKYGKADIFIVPNHYGLNLRSKNMEIAVEVKTGFSLSMPQILRYFVGNYQRSLVLWRIRNQQVLIFEGTEIRQLLVQFIRMIVSRADRLLLAPELKCKHAPERKRWSPNQQQLQEAFTDFSSGIIATLPSVVETVSMMCDKNRTFSKNKVGAVNWPRKNSAEEN